MVIQKRIAPFVKHLLALVAGSLASIFPLTVNGQTENYSWNSVAIGGGGFVSGITTSKTEPGLLYARTDVGGAYRWDDVNGKWVPLMDWVSENELGFLGVESIAIDPVEANKVYMLVGTSYFNAGKTAILRSDDYGETFSITEVTSQFRAHGNGMGRQTGEKLMIDPNDTDIIFCGTRTNGLFKSVNAGVTWSKVGGLSITTTPNGNGISFVILDPSTGSTGSATQTIIAGVSRTGANLYRSDDGGSTFTEIAGAPTTLMPHRAALASDRNLYVTYANNAGPWDITGAGAIWKYNLQTSTWTNVTPSGFTGAFGGISVDPANPNRLVASSVNSYWTQDNSYGDRIFLTTDGGSNWVDVVNSGFDLDPNGISWVDGHAIHWAGSIEFDPFDTKKAWVISGNGVFRTDDIDASLNVWKFYVQGLEETVPLDIVSIPNGPLVSVIGDYDGFRHTDVTEYAPMHMPRMGTTSGIAFAAQNPDIMLRVGEDMYYSTDMGVTWTECTINGMRGSVAISADGSVFLHGPEGSVTTYRSVDRGSTWTLVEGLNISGARPVADPVNPKKFYAYNSNGSVMVSTDGGVTFSAAGSAGSNGSKVIRTAPGREGDVWIPLHNGGLSRSMDSGQTFSTISGVTYCGAIGFGKEAPGQSYPAIYIWGTVSGVLGIHRSTDEGVTWKRVNDDAHEYGGPANGQFVIGDMNVYGRVYMSTAGRGIVYGESDQTCMPTWVVPFIKVNDEPVTQTSLITVTPGNTVVLSPEPASGGSWSWTGPASLTSSDREITLAGISQDQSGIYTVSYTDVNGCESALQTFTVQVRVPAESITVSGEGGVTTITEKEGTLQMIAEVLPGNASDKSVTWSITNGEEAASLSADGLLTAIEDGEVTIRATAKDGSGVFGETVITIINQNITSTLNPVNNEGLEVSPNHVSRLLTIRSTQPVEDITLLSLQGNVIWKRQSNSRMMTVDLEGLPAGMYLLQLTDRKNGRHIRRIVKR